jgi:hypothetical protein
MSANSETLRPRSPSPPRAERRAGERRDEGGDGEPAELARREVDAQDHAADRERERRNQNPVRIEGTARPRKSARRLAGEARSVGRVCELERDPQAERGTVEHEGHAITSPSIPIASMQAGSANANANG